MSRDGSEGGEGRFFLRHLRFFARHFSGQFFPSWSGSAPTRILHPAAVPERRSSNLTAALKCLLTVALTGLTAAFLAGCGRETQSSPPSSATAPDPLSIILTPHSGSTPLDAEIRKAIEAVRASTGSTVTATVAALEKLGWLFISKARVTFDPGFYKLAEQCALAMETREPGSPDSMLLRGHVLQNLHRFHEAEPIARALVAKRSVPFDFGLLGDVLMEQGKLADAIDAYQRMADLRPDSQALVRIAHVRFLKGDVDGALEAARDATRAVSARDAETAAWMRTRLALYEFQSGHADDAQAACAAALQVQTDYPPALLLQSRMLLAAKNGEQAIEPIRTAARLNPLPEYLWALSETLRATGQKEEAAKTEAQLQRTGAAEDPRTYSLFLATRHVSPALALELAERELGQRADVHTHDALAWALAANDRWDDAAAQIAMALAEGTVDARFLLHATVIATHRAHNDEAREFAAKTARVQHMLLPSEREAFEKIGQLLAESSTVQGRRSAADKLESKR